MFLAPQNTPHAISVLTLGNKLILYCILYCIRGRACEKTEVNDVPVVIMPVNETTAALTGARHLLSAHVLFWQPGVGQNIALQTSPTAVARLYSVLLISYLSVCVCSVLIQQNTGRRTIFSLIIVQLLFCSFEKRLIPKILAGFVLSH